MTEIAGGIPDMNKVNELVDLLNEADINSKRIKEIIDSCQNENYANQLNIIIGRIRVKGITELESYAIKKAKLIEMPEETRNLAMWLVEKEAA